MEDVWLPVGLGFAAAVAIPRPATVALVALVWPLYSAAVAVDVWRHGLGESWAAATALLTIATTFGGGAGLLVGHGIRLRRADRARARSQRHEDR